MNETRLTYALSCVKFDFGWSRAMSTMLNILSFLKKNLCIFPRIVLAIYIAAACVEWTVMRFHEWSCNRYWCFVQCISSYLISFEHMHIVMFNSQKIRHHTEKIWYHWHSIWGSIIRESTMEIKSIHYFWWFFFQFRSWNVLTHVHISSYQICKLLFVPFKLMLAGEFYNDKNPPLNHITTVEVKYCLSWI